MNDAQPADAPVAAIVIAVHNRRDDVLACLASLAGESLEARRVEVLLVDDASTDGLADAVAESFPSVKLLRNRENLGPAAARNLGARATTASVLLFLDSDGVVAPGWLDAMLAAHDGKTVLLGCAVDFEGGRVQGLPRRATFLGKSLRCAPDRANTGPSCNLGVPRACFEELAGFDEEIPYYFEDSDLCIRARKAGYRFRYLPQAVFRHKGNERKKGDAIRMQEHNSTYAMLKAYRRQPLARLAFTVCNGTWLLLRLVLWTTQGRREDAARLWSGWRSAYSRYGALR